MKLYRNRLTFALCAALFAGAGMAMLTGCGQCFLSEPYRNVMTGEITCGRHP